jgi:hypothetical protein
LTVILFNLGAFYEYCRSNNPRPFGAGFVLACLSLIPALSWAQAQPEWTTTLGAGAQTQQSGGATKIVYSGGDKAQTVARTVSAAANDGVVVAERVAIQTASGAAEVTATRKAAGSVLRRAIGGALAGSVAGPVGTVVGAAVGGALAGELLKDWLDSQGVKKDPISPSGYSGASGSVSAITVPASQYCGVPGCFGNLASLLNAAAPGYYTVGSYSGGQAPEGMQAARVLMSREDADYMYYHPYESPPRGTTVFYYNSPTETLRCPDYTAVPPGGCPGSGPGLPLTAAEIGDKLAAAPMPPDDKLTGAVNARVSDGSLSVPATEPEVSGPAYVDSSPRPSYVSTVSAVGTASSSQTEVIRTPLSYSGSTVTQGQPVKTATTAATAADGSTSTKTETAPVDKPDVCKAFPWLFICSEIGEPDKTQVPKSTKNIDFESESLNLPSGCPGDISVGRFGVVSMASACTAANDMRGIIIAAGGIAALMICIAAVRGNS